MDKLKENRKGKTNILYVSHYNHYRMGGQKSTIALIEKLDRQKFSPFAIVPARGELSEKLENIGCPCFVVPMCNIKFKNIFKLMLQWYRIKKLLKSQHIDIIHTDQDHDTCVCGFAKKSSNAKLIWHVRLTRPYKLDKINRSLADGIITVADDATNRFGYSKQVLEKCRTIYNGVNCDLFHPVESKRVVREKLNLPADKFILTFVGQIKKGKGIFDLAEAVKIMRVTFGDHAMPHILYIGTPNNDRTLSELNAFISGNQLNGFVEILSQRKNIHEWMQASDALILPSHEGVEGMGRVLYEAMACGTAAISTDISGNREALTPETGVLVPERSPAEIAAAVKLLMDEGEHLATMQIEGRKRALDLFNFSKNIKSVEAFYEELAAESLGLQRHV